MQQGEHSEAPSVASLIDTDKMKAMLHEKLVHVQEVKHNPLSGLVEGRIVHYVMNETYAHGKGEHRPAIIVKVFDSLRESGTVNMVVFLDGLNDVSRKTVQVHPDTPLMIWRTSVHYSEEKEPGTWHWPEKV